MFNVPAIVTALSAAMLAIHAARDWLLDPTDNIQGLLLFAFIPGRYTGIRAHMPWPGGFPADVWTFVTYAFLHGSWTHLIVNLVWMLAFGSALARRFGPIRFLVFFLVTAAAGAAMHLATHAGQTTVMVGASGAISGCMAAAARFMFQPGGPLGGRGPGTARRYDVPAKPLLGVIRDPRVLLFLGVWFGLNLLFGLGSFPLAGEGQNIAWEAHIGGFLAGLLLFPLFDRGRVHQHQAAGQNGTAGPNGDGPQMRAGH
jgi:membrane associated rhomboid family serine protease